MTEPAPELIKLHPLCWLSDPFAPRGIVEEKQCTFCARIIPPKLLDDDASLAHVLCDCGAFYCSQACQEQDDENHARICVGKVETTDHPLYHFHMTSLQYPEWYGGLQLALRHVLCSFSEGILETSSTIEAEITKEECIQKSYQWIAELSNERGPLSLQRWAALVKNTQEHRHVVVQIPSAMAQKCESITLANSWKSVEGIDLIKSLDDDDISPQFLMDESELYFPPRQCRVLIAESLQQSCIPSHDVIFSLRSKSCFDLDLQPKKPPRHRDLEPTVCLIEDNTQDLDGRTEQIAERGLHPCGCLRCQWEGKSKNEFSVRELEALLQLALDHQRHEDALCLCHEVIRHEPVHRFAVFHRARISGWIEDYVGREKYLEKATAILPSDSRIQSEWHECTSYYRDPWNSSRDTNDNFNYGHVKDWEDGSVYLAENLLDAHECREMVELVENAVPTLWTTSRHYAVPTTDVPVYQVKPLLAWFNEQLKTRIFPLLHRQFEVSCKTHRFRMLDAFLVKYSSIGQQRLPMHNDQSMYSIIVAMNERDQYAAGGNLLCRHG